MSVNREAVQQWIDALRSGKYQQIRGRLSAGTDRVCAVGVVVREGMYAEEPGGFVRFHDIAGVLGVPALDLTEVVGWNDMENKDFFEIADLLYAKYLKEPEETT